MSEWQDETDGRGARILVRDEACEIRVDDCAGNPCFVRCACLVRAFGNSFLLLFCLSSIPSSNRGTCAPLGGCGKTCPSGEKGDHQGDEIGFGTAGGNDAASFRGIAEKLLEPVQNNQFNLRGTGGLQPHAGKVPDLQGPEPQRQGRTRLELPAAGAGVRRPRSPRRRSEI